MEAYIFDGVRTPRGAVRGGGGLSSHAPIGLLGTLLDALDARTGVMDKAVDFTLGCVTQKGEQGGNLARTALLNAGYAKHASGTVINSFCCSSLDASRLAALKASGDETGLYLAGGVESMTRVAPFSDKGPYYSDPAVMQKAAFSPMWLSADFVATHAGIGRADADAYAARSQEKAAQAWAANHFAGSVAAPEGAPLGDEPMRAGTTVDVLAGLPTFQEKMPIPGGDETFLSAFPDFQAVNHIHHAGSAPALADAASLLLIGSREAGYGAGLKPRARIRAATSCAADPVLSLTGGIEAASKLLAETGMEASDIDLYEFNEAYAAVCLLFSRQLGIDEDRLNVNGGAIALGHPMGATGGILLLTLLDELERRDQTTGLVSVSGAAGLGSAMIIERI